MTSFAAHQQHMTSYDSTMLLGRLCWYSVPESVFDHTFVVQQMQAAGLDTFTLPPVPRPADVFKRACTAATRKKVPVSDVGTYNNYLIRPVGHDDDHVWRKIIRETVDSNDRRLGYIEIVELTFERKTSKISTNWNPMAAEKIVNNASGMTWPTTTYEYDPQAVGMVDEILDNFKAWNDSITSAALRELIRKILTKFHATSVRPAGGIYFVNESRHVELEALSNLINSLQGASFHVLPLLNDAKQREMLRLAFEDESVEEIDRLLGEIMELKSKNKKISADKYSSYAAEYTRLMAKGKEYQSLLGTAMAETDSRLEIFQNSIVSLMEYVS